MVLGAANIGVDIVADAYAASGMFDIELQMRGVVIVTAENGRRMGAERLVDDGIDAMGIAGNTPPYAFFKEDFSPEFAPTKGKFDHGYVDYGKMQARAAMPRAPFSTEFYSFRVDFRSGEATLSLGSTNQPPAHAGTNVKLRVSAKKDFVTAGHSGHLYVIEDHDPAKSEGFFLQDDKDVYMVFKDGSGKFTVPDSAPL